MPQRKLLIGCGFVNKAQGRLLWLVLALALVRGLVYVSIIPPWQSPDEPFHFAQARLLLPPASGQTAEQWQQEMLDSLERFNFYILAGKPVSPGIPARFSKLVRNTPPYWLYALAALPWIEYDVTLQLYIMRLVSVLMLAGSVALVYLASKELFPDDTFVPIVATSLILFAPQHTYINASVNDGNLAELAATLALYFLVRATLRGYSMAKVTLILASTVLALWAKQTTYFLAIGMMVALALVIIRMRIWNWRSWIGVLLGVILVGWIVWQVRELRGILLALQEYWFTLVNQPLALNEFWKNWLVGYRSLWASLGWYVVTDNHWWDKPALALIGVAAVGLILFEMRTDAHDPSDSRRRLAIGWLGFSLLLAILELIFINAFLLNFEGFGGIQGRYIYVAALPFAILFAIGARQLVPEAWHKIVSLAFVILLLLFDSAILLTYQIPFFYPLWWDVL